jgi:hypothetical protein
MIRLLAIFIGSPQEWVRDLARTGESALSKKRLSGQYKVNLDTGQVYMVGSRTSDKPVKEQQASLLQWGEDMENLERWERNARIEDDGR